MKKASQTIEYENLIDAEKYILTYGCSQCDNKELLRTKAMTGKEIRKNWVFLIMSAQLNAGKCKICNYSTFSDLNVGHLIIKSENKPQTINLRIPIQ